MEKSFDFGALLRNNEKKHKSKPIQLVSVAGGIQKRLEINIKNRKSTRLTTFDSVRNLPKCNSPVPISEAQMKVEHRRQQLEKWKAEKEKKKKEMAAQKKKPFIAGVPRQPLKFVPPPPPPPKPSTSGRVTRSQTRSSVKPKTKSSPVQATRGTQSFAPKNASFKPPEIKNLIKLPTLAPLSKTKNKKACMITFDPVIPNAPNTMKQTRTRPVLTRQNATEVKATRNRPQVETRSSNRGKVTKKPSPKKLSKNLQSSSSGSDIEANKIIKRIKTPVARKPLKEVKVLPPKMLVLESSSYTEKSSDNSSPEKSRKYNSKRNSMLFRKNTSPSSSDKFSSDLDPSSTEENTTPVVANINRKSLPKSFIPRPLKTDSSSTNLSSDIEFMENNTPVIKLTRTSLPYTPKNRVPKSESGSEEKLRSPKSPIELPLSPEQMESAKISPCVTFSRGKDNARKEMKWKIDEGLLDDDASDIESVEHFRQQLSSEIKRMTEMCDTWDKISEHTELPEFVQEAVLTAVGQARLLMTQKMQQFATLVERAARPEPGSTLVTPADLHGFWDMVFMQVVNIDLRFKKLEELKARGWVEEQPVDPVVEKKKVPAKPAAKKVAKPTGGPSRLRDMIAAARKAKKQQGNSPSEATLAPPVELEKTFEAPGFFRIVSPVRSPRTAPSTPRNNLLKAVLSSEAKKASNSKNSTPFAMLRASLIGKNVEYDGIAPLPKTPHMTPVNLFATPGRSILKSANVSKSGKKSIKVVLFDESDSELNQTFKEITDSDDFETPLNSSAFTSEVKEIQDKENTEVESSTVKTRSQRKSLNTITEQTSCSSEQKEVKTPRRSSRNKKEDTHTPSRRSTRKKPTEVKSTDIVEEKRKRSTRKKALQELEANVIEETIVTPKRSSRRSKALAC